MPKYKVEICRIGYAFKIVEVEAADRVEAASLARARAGDHTYQERDAKYEVGYVKVMTPSEAEIIAILTPGIPMSPTMIQDALSANYSIHAVRVLLIDMLANRRLNLTYDWKVFLDKP